MSPLRKRVSLKSTTRQSPEGTASESPSVSVATSPSTHLGSQGTSNEYVNSSNSAAELQMRIETAIQRMQSAQEQLAEDSDSKTARGTRCKRLTTFLRRLTGLGTPDTGDITKSNELFDIPKPRDDEGNSSGVLRRRTLEGINLTHPKVQALTGNGRVPRKPTQFQIELNNTLEEEKRRRRRSTLSFRDYSSFINNGHIEDLSDEMEELVHDNGSKSESVGTPIQGMLSALSSEPSGFVQMPTSMETDMHETASLHGQKPFEVSRPSSPSRQGDSSPVKPSNSKGKERVAELTSLSDEESQASSEQRPPSSYRLGCSRKEGCAGFTQSKAKD